MRRGRISVPFAALGRRFDAAGNACGGRGDAGVWSFSFTALPAAGGGVVWLAPERVARVREELGKERDPGGEAAGTGALFLGYAVRGVLRHRIPRVLPGFAPPGPPSDGTRAALLAPCAGAMTEVQAALAFAQWRRRDALASDQRARARQIAGVLARCPAFAPLPGLAPDGAVHLAPVLLRGESPAAAVLRARRILHAAGVQTEEAYPVPFAVPLPHARDLAARLFLVPVGPALDARQLARIASALEAAGGTR